MGEMADHFIDRMIDGYRPSRNKPTFQAGSGDFMWRTADGGTINMYDMTPEHRENAMRICRERRNSGKLKQLEQVQEEMRKARPQDFLDEIPFEPGRKLWQNPKTPSPTRNEHSSTRKGGTCSKPPAR